MNKDIQDFAKSHGIQILDTNKRASRYHKIDLKYFTDPKDFNTVQHNIVIDSEPLYTVQIAESELEKIATFEQQVFNNMRTSGHHNLFETMMELQEKEEQLRNRYPAVKKAYEQYSLMLKLAQSGEL